MSAINSDKNIGFSVMMIAVTFVLIMVIKAITGSMIAGGPADMSPAAIAKRIAPVGNLNTGEPITAAAASDSKPAGNSAPRSGEAIYNSVCLACHASGAAGAPVFGNVEAWATRIAQGMDSLVKNATNGLNAMPPRGTCADCSNDELKAAIEFMVSKSGGDAAAASPAASEAPAVTESVAVETPAPVAAAPAAAAGRGGDLVYNRYCIACHAAGVAGAPRLGDAAAWAPRAAKGIDGLMHSATNGLNAMPPRGTCADCSDVELQGAIEYMVNSSQ